MFRRQSSRLLCAPASSVAPCITALNTDLTNIKFWNEFAIKNKVPVIPSPGSSLGQQQHVIFTSAATAALQCLEPTHAGDITVATNAMKRWSDLDVDDEITKLLAYNRTARDNLAQALIAHQHSSEFVAYACRAITNMALLPPQEGGASSASPDASTDSNEPEHLSHLAQSGIVPVLVKTLARECIFDVVLPSGRGAAWILQAVQNLVLKSDIAAEKFADFGSEQRRRVNPDSLENAEHDELSQETTAEHFISVAVLRILERNSSSWHSLVNEDDDDQELMMLKKRIATVAVDSGLASIARLLSMSADRGTAADANSTIQHRSEFASPSVFRAVVNTLANTQITPFSPALQHKTWECLRQLVSTKENIPPLLHALHAADGMSGMKLLSKWLENTKNELPSILFVQQPQQQQDPEFEEMKHEILQRSICGMDVLIELTSASTTASNNISNNNSTEESAVTATSEIEQQEEPEYDDNGNQIFKSSVSSDDAKTQRWDSAMQSITSGTLSKFVVSLLTSLHEGNTSNSNNKSSSITTFVDDFRIKCLTLLLHLSHSDPYVRHANCLVVIQRTILKPYINQLLARQLGSTSNSDSKPKNPSSSSPAFLVAQQKSMSIIWNALNFSDSMKTIEELRLQQDVELIVKNCCCSSSSTSTPEEENLKAAGEKLLEKMKVLYHQK